ncbi:MAG TPA: DsbC family protein [Rudaea sp.]
MRLKILFAAAFALIAHVALAADPGDKNARDAFKSLLPNVTIDRVVKSDLPGFYEILANGQIVYVSTDGKFLLQGNLYNVAAKKSLTDASIAAYRKEMIDKLPKDKRLVFAPQNPKHTVTVFTDVDCPYCRQFHKQIAAYNQAGIAVNYVLFPLDIHPGADKKAVAVWCAQDRNSAYTAAMNGQDPGAKTCSNPIAETKALSIALGIDATPTILAEDGTHVDGSIAMNPAQLAAELDRLAAAAKSGKGDVAAAN